MSGRWTWAFYFFVAVPPLSGDSVTPPHQLWRLGDTWKLSIEHYSPDGKAASYEASVVVSAEEPIGGRRCWKLLFIPGRAAPAGMEMSSVWVDQETGWPRKVSRVKNGSGPFLRKIGVASIIVKAPELPIDCIPPNDIQVSTGAASLVVKSALVEQLLERHGELVIGKNQELSVRQKWQPGEKWWREFERSVNGRKEISAKLLPLPPPASAVPLWIDPQEALLREGPKLQACVNLVDKQPKLGDIFARLDEATGLTFTMAENLQLHEPEFGIVNLPNAPAWAVMKLVARTDLQGGYFKKTETGYQLVAEASLRERAPSPPRLASRTRLSLISLIILFVVGLGLLYARRTRIAKEEPDEKTVPPARGGQKGGG